MIRVIVWIERRRTWEISSLVWVLMEALDKGVCRMEAISIEEMELDLVVIAGHRTIS